jgi:competence protein ComEC
MIKYLYLILLSIFFLGGFCLYQNAKFNDGKLHMVICKVGQGDAIFIRTPNGSDVLIDGGPDDSVLNCLSSHMPFWDRTIEIVMLTHPHVDHLVGLISVLNRYNVMHYVTENIKNSASSLKRLEDSLAAQNLTAKYVTSGERIDFADKTQLLTVWPTSDWMQTLKLQDSNNLGQEDSSLDTNGFSLIQLLTFGNFKALLTGDAGSLTEEKIATAVGKVDVLKVPHHGSKTGMSDYFLSQIKPSVALISVGINNPYGHPTKQALELLRLNNIKTLRTDRDGEVEIITDGKTFSVN